MKAEKIILSFIAILIGLLVAGGAFYLYQSTKVVPETNKKIISTALLSSTPTPSDTSFITLDNPKDESVTTKRTVLISGKTKSDATIIVSSEESDQVAKPASDGGFSLTHSVGDGTNIISITAVFADGSEKTIHRTITVSSEGF